jgi:LAGLIDADG endonuclease
MVINKMKTMKNFNDKNWFEQWLVGFTDGDGTFFISYQNNKWNLVYKIALSRYNLRALYFIKKQLGFGSINKDNSKAQFVIRDRKVIETKILPIFDKYPLLTSKQFDYLKFRQALFILNSKDLNQDEKYKKLFSLKNEKLPENYISSSWNNVALPVKSVNDIKDIVTKPWLVGFVEAEGSFYLTSKDSLRVVHGFGITQKLDSIVLESIRLILHIPTKIRYKSKHNYYILDTTNSRAVENIIEFFHNTMKGMKSPEYRIWSRSYTKHKGNYDKLFYIRVILRKMKKKLVEL